MYIVHRFFLVVRERYMFPCFGLKGLIGKGKIYTPIAPNSTLVNPANAPFSNTRTRSVSLFGLLIVAENTDSSLSIEAVLVSWSALIADVGI